MTQLESELQAIKAEVISMWTLVESQLQKSKTALLHFDKDLAREIVLKEKRVNAFELKLDRDCEDIFALYCPVAVDLRFLLAVLKINNNLERIGDIAEGIAKYIIESPAEFHQNLFTKTEMSHMYDEAISILSDTRVSFEKEDTVLARSIFKRDEILDTINKKAQQRIAECIREDLEVVNDALYIISIIRKLERVGDQTKNIAEEIIFYIEAKVLKHQKGIAGIGGEMPVP
jgi:phosphate transport system protein